MADTKKEYTSNLHPKGDLGTTVYPNVKSENIIDKDTTAYNAGKVPDSSLVQKSLDSLNEKIETNKIQTETNKTNIATLQGDVAGLQTDNETTKTTIAGLVSDNTQNKQDIATLKANYTEVQSQANTNSSDIALLKTNAIKKDTDASLKSLTLPSASDLKTKDGTTFGGGSSIYNGTEFLPTFDIATLKDIYIPLTGGTMKGNFNLNDNQLNFNYHGRIGSLGRISLSNYPTDFLNNQNGYALYLNYCGKLFFSYEQFYLGFFDDNHDSYTFVGIDKKNGLCLSSQSNDGTIRLMSYDETTKNITHEFKMSNNSYPTIDGNRIITDVDLDGKQDKRFVHTVEIHYASNGSYFCFTGTSDKNTPIDSVQDLTTVFTNRDLVGVGVFGSAGLSKIHVGSSINDTTFKKYMNNGEYTNPSEETFAIVFNTTGFTITDNVTAM